MGFLPSSAVASIYSFITAIRRRVSPEFIGSRKCVPMAFTSGLSAVNAIGMQMCDPINSGLSIWQLTVYVHTFTESGINPASKHYYRFSPSVENERADAGRDGQPVSQD